MNCFSVGRPIRYNLSSTASCSVRSVGFDSTGNADWVAAVSSRALDLTSRVLEDATIVPPFRSMLGQQGALTSSLPPRPELDLEGAGQSPGDQVNDSSRAAQDFGLPCHFRFEEQGMIIDLRGDENRLVCAGGAARGARRFQSLLGAGGDRSHRPIKRLVRIGAGPEHYLFAHLDAGNFLFRNEDLRRHGFEVINLRDQVPLLYEPAP